MSKCSGAILGGNTVIAISLAWETEREKYAQTQTSRQTSEIMCSNHYIFRARMCSPLLTNSHPAIRNIVHLVATVRFTWKICVGRPNLGPNGQVCRAQENT